MRSLLAARLAEVDHRHAELVDRAELNKAIGRGDTLESERDVDGLVLGGSLQRVEAGADKTGGADEVFHLALAAARRAQIRKRSGYLPPLFARNWDGGEIDDLAPLACLRENE
jgi:hypothetical protein